MYKIQEFNFANKKVLLRVDLNVPLDDHGRVVDTHRMQAILPTVRKILQDKGSIVLLSHFGRPRGVYTSKYSLKHIVPALSQVLGQEIIFSENCIGPLAEARVQKLLPGQILLMENVRFHIGEQNQEKYFAQALSRLGDVFVNDAFGVMHRADSSIVQLPQYFQFKMLGYLVEKEIAIIDKILYHNKAPVTAVIGGAKVSDKLLLLDCLLDSVDNFLIGGAMAYTFFYALGGAVGNSLVEKKYTNQVKLFLEKAEKKKVNIQLPEDSLVVRKIDPLAETCVVSSKHIPENWSGVDIGPKAIQQFNVVLNQSQTILWNGPMGICEIPSFSFGTQTIAKTIARSAADKKKMILVGGGDTDAVFRQIDLSPYAVPPLSTGGGALLKYVEKKTLVGIEAMQKNYI